MATFKITVHTCSTDVRLVKAKTIKEAKEKALAEVKDIKRLKQNMEVLDVEKVL